MYLGASLNNYTVNTKFPTYIIWQGYQYRFRHGGGDKGSMPPPPTVLTFMSPESNGRRSLFLRIILWFSCTGICSKSRETCARKEIILPFEYSLLGCDDVLNGVRESMRGMWWPFEDSFNVSENCRLSWTSWSRQGLRSVGKPYKGDHRRLYHWRSEGV